MLAVTLLEGVGMLGLIGFVILALLFFFNRRVGGSFWHLGRTQAGKLGDWANNQDPAGQMRQAALDAAGELKNADTALITCHVLQQRLERQVLTDTTSLGRLEGKLTKKLADGASPTDAEIVELTKRVRDLRNSIAENKGQIASQVQLYKNTLSQANSAGQKVKGALERADRLKVRLDLGVARQNVQSMLAKYTPEAVNSRMAEIDRFEQAGQAKLDGYSATEQVAKDRGVTDNDDDETPETDPELEKIITEMQNRTATKPAATA